MQGNRLDAYCLWPKVSEIADYRILYQVPQNKYISAQQCIDNTRYVGHLIIFKSHTTAD